MSSAVEPLFLINDNVQAQQENATQYKLLEMVSAPLRWSLIQLGLELNVFEALIKPMTAEQLASQLEFKVKQAGLLLDALCSLEILTKQQDHYQIQQDWAPYLCASSETSMKDTLLHLAKVRQSTLQDIKQSLTEGPINHVSTGFSSPEFWAKATANLRSFHRSVSNDFCLTIFNNFQPWLGKGRRVLDLGAGSEMLAQTISSRYPGTEITLFDLPSCVDAIKDKSGVASEPSIRLRSGDYNEASLEGPYDIVWSSMSLYYANDLNSLLKKIRSNLAPGGLFISLHEGLSQSRTQPAYHVIGRFIPALNGNDLSFNRGDIAAAMRQSGFTRVTSETCYTPFGEFELDVGLV